MSTRRRVTRTVLGLLALVAAAGACSLVAALALGQVGSARSLVLSLVWVCSLGSAVLAVAAAQEETDPDDNPRFLATVVHGLVDEWRR